VKADIDAGLAVRRRKASLSPEEEARLTDVTMVLTLVLISDPRMFEDRDVGGGRR
jgi:hypothetical protein